MADYAFYAAFLRFVAAKTERISPEVEAMMGRLAAIADQVAVADGFTVAARDLAVSGRALAGVAGFLQQHILPEAVAAGNPDVEAQVRWVIDTSMEITTQLVSRAETAPDREFHAQLPPPPGLAATRH